MKIGKKKTMVVLASSSSSSSSSSKSLFLLIKTVLIILISQIRASSTAVTLGPGPSQLFDHIEIITEPNEVILFWKIEKTEIIFEIHAKTPGWLLFGLGPDLITVWLNKTIGHFSNRDAQLNIRTSGIYSPLELKRIDQFLVVKFIRSFKICTGMRYNDLTGRVRVVYSIGSGQNISFVDMKRGEVDLQISEYSGLAQCLDSNVETRKVAAIRGKMLVKDMIWFYWNASRDGKFKVEVHVKGVGGWAMLGFSEDGKARMADVVVFGWDGEVIDGFIDESGKIEKDLNQDWKRFGWRFNDGFTVYRFERDVVLCDPDDLIIQRGSPHIIFSYGLDTKVDNLSDLDFNTNLGTTQIIALDKPHTHNHPNTSFIDLTISSVVLLNPNPSSCYSHLFTVSDYTLTKRHIHAWQLILNDPKQINIHKILVYECHTQPLISTHSGQCRSDPNISRFCQASSIGYWLPGLNFLNHLPDDTGYPIGGDSTDYKHLLIEIYHSPINSHDSISYIASLTLRYFLTDKLRPYELGLLRLGSESDPIGILIPPGQTKFTVSSICHRQCMKKGINSLNNLTVVQITPMMNSYGREISTKILHNTKKVWTYLHSNIFFNSSFHANYHLQPRVHLRSTDLLLTECVYSTIGHSKFVFGGLAHNNELCQQFLLYYPRKNNFKHCQSFPDVLEQNKLINSLTNGKVLNNTSYNSVLASLYKGFESLDRVTVVPSSFVQSLQRLYFSQGYNSVCQGTSKLVKDTLAERLNYNTKYVCSLRETDKRVESSFKGVSNGNVFVVAVSSCILLKVLFLVVVLILVD